MTSTKLQLVLGTLDQGYLLILRKTFKVFQIAALLQDLKEGLNS